MIQPSFYIDHNHYIYDHKMKICQQTNPKPYSYDIAYTEKYNSYGELGKRMAYLRFGVLIGTLGKTPNSLLDVGYGNGDFLKVCHNNVDKIAGSDIEPMYPINPIDTISDIYQEHFDVVCFFDSLEHFINPFEISQLRTKYIFISLPEFHPHLGLEWFRDWRHRKPDEHIWHFSREGLINFFSEIGYKLVKIFNFEDIIRKNEEQDESNIISGIFKKK